MNVLQRGLRILVVVSLCCVAQTALAAAAHPVCSTADFMSFITKYAVLSTQDQLTCVDLPFTHDKKKYTSTGALAKGLKGGKLIPSAKDFLAPYKAWTPLFVLSGTEFSDQNKRPVVHDLVCFVTKGENEGEVTLTEGGTFIFRITGFIRKNNVWRANSIITDVYGDD